ncbi:hypothetical protein MYX06_01190 [Patescibacteria group bacterium AH-259-L05]|nr:hypothetical protein [Patescibacteria group bacterium AH-259-L05]
MTFPEALQFCLGMLATLAGALILMAPVMGYAINGWRGVRSALSIAPIVSLVVTVKYAAIPTLIGTLLAWLQWL